jgi:Zn-dependent M28 family amino/carboxypeptidase
MINLDMVGRLNLNDSLTVYATSSSSQWDEVLNNDSRVELNIKNIPSIFPRSDHASFIEAGVPSIMLHTGIHKDYHTPNDDFQKIDGDGLTRITEFILHTLQNLNRFSNSRP